MSYDLPPLDIPIEKSPDAPQKSSFTIDRSFALMVGFVVVMLGLLVVLYESTGGITGAVAYTPHATYSEDTQFSIVLRGTTAVNITGTAMGEGSARITLLENGNEHVLYSYNPPIDGVYLQLERSKYLVGEVINFTTQGVEHMYLMGDEPVLIEGTNLQISSPGNYTIALVATDGQDETVTFEMLESFAPQAFVTCGEVCATQMTGNATILVDINGNASVRIDTVELEGENAVPQLARDIPDVNGTSIVINLSEYFVDLDDDDLVYDTSENYVLDVDLDGSILTIDGPAGSYTIIVYASDLQEITPSNIFSVTLIDDNVVNSSVTVNATNSTVMSEDLVTPNATNNVSSVTNTTNATPIVNTTLVHIPDATIPETSCDNPDPNKRPLSCIQGNESSYFRPEEILLENKNAVTVGQLTPIGNLLIRGEVIEHATGSPASHDYALGYADEHGEFVGTMWIDSATGNLYLRGSLTEANGNIVIDEGLSAMANRKGIVLALVNRHTGDLTVRGNLVPYRRSLG